jgi:hypothetical protein
MFTITDSKVRALDQIIIQKNLYALLGIQYQKNLLELEQKCLNVIKFRKNDFILQVFFIDLDSAEEFERAPELDAVDYFMDEEQINSQEEKTGYGSKRKTPFLINVPDPIFAARSDSFANNPAILPLNHQEQLAINNLKDTKRQGKVCISRI